MNHALAQQYPGTLLRVPGIAEDGQLLVNGWYVIRSRLNDMCLGPAQMLV